MLYVVYYLIASYLLFVPLLRLHMRLEGDYPRLSDTSLIKIITTIWLFSPLTSVIITIGIVSILIENICPHVLRTLGKLYGFLEDNND